MTKRILSAAALALLPSLALAGERILLVKTSEDSGVTPDLELCQATGFDPLNVVLGASVWSLETRASRGEVVNETVRRLGTATGCVSLAPNAVTGPFLIRFDLEDGRYLASGSCDILSFTVPARGILLVGCALAIVSGPPGFVGGIATSASVFNPRSIPGFGTGSVWTLHVYTDEP
jgi:hypothetical protein